MDLPLHLLAPAQDGAMESNDVFGGGWLPDVSEF
jgi:hypothetical protein